MIHKAYVFTTVTESKMQYLFLKVIFTWWNLYSCRQIQSCFSFCTLGFSALSWAQNLFGCMSVYAHPGCFCLHLALAWRGRELWSVKRWLMSAGQWAHSSVASDCYHKHPFGSALTCSVSCLCPIPLLSFRTQVSFCPCSARLEVDLCRFYFFILFYFFCNTFQPIPHSF